MLVNTSTAPLPFAESHVSVREKGLYQAWVRAVNGSSRESGSSPPSRDGSNDDASAADELHEKDDEREHQQQMDEAADGRQRHHAQEPEDQEDQDDGPQHGRHLLMTMSGGKPRAKDAAWRTFKQGLGNGNAPRPAWTEGRSAEDEAVLAAWSELAPDDATTVDRRVNVEVEARGSGDDVVRERRVDGHIADHDRRCGRAGRERDRVGRIALTGDLHTTIHTGRGLVDVEQDEVRTGWASGDRQRESGGRRGDLARAVLGRVEGERAFTGARCLGVRDRRDLVRALQVRGERELELRGRRWGRRRHRRWGR